MFRLFTIHTCKCLGHLPYIYFMLTAPFFQKKVLFVLTCVCVVGFEDVKGTVDICLVCRDFDFLLFFWFMPILSRFVSMTFSLMVLEPTVTFICSDVHPGSFAFRRISMKFWYCLDDILSFFSR